MPGGNETPIDSLYFVATLPRLAITPQNRSRYKLSQVHRGGSDNGSLWERLDEQCEPFQLALSQWLELRA